MSQHRSINGLSAQISDRPEILGPPRIDAFSNWDDFPSAPNDLVGDDDSSQVCQVTSNAGVRGRAPSTPQRITFRRFAPFPIPNLDPSDPLLRVLPLADWNFHRPVDGYLSLSVGQAFDLGLIDTRQRKAIASASIAGALCIPLVMAPMQAAAGAPTGWQGEVGGEQDPIALLATRSGESKRGAIDSPASGPTAGDPTMSDPAASDTRVPVSTEAPSMGIPSGAWQAVAGRQVRVATDDSLIVEGEVLSFDETSVTIATQPAGTIVQVDRSRVTAMAVVESPPPAAVPPAAYDATDRAPRGPTNVEVDPRARKFVVAGGVLMGVGGVATVTGAVLTSVCILGPLDNSHFSSTSYGYGTYHYEPCNPVPLAVGLFVPGVLVMMAVGIPLLAKGARMQADARAAAMARTIQKHRISIAPTYQRRTKAWGGGLSFQF
jgi:hypothetical protein